MSQSDAILDALLRGERLTPLDALTKFHCLRLSGRIFDLKAKGYKIEAKIVETPSGKKVAEYFLPKIKRGENYCLPLK
ncbi:MAG: hypothetical protein KGJ13_10630 [Patescibacteria group bacterium]|nr:hypothetical protein [Patescibacteria group bacterium]